MGFFFFIPLTALIVIVGPIWIIAHYMTRWRTAKVLSPDDEKMLAELWELAPKMESRINTLEKILDAEAPDWRKEV